MRYDHTGLFDIAQVSEGAEKQQLLCVYFKYRQPVSGIFFRAHFPHIKSAGFDSEKIYECHGSLMYVQVRFSL